MSARLLPSGDLEVTSLASAPADASPLAEQLTHAFASLRVLSARENVARLGRDQGYRLEDAAHVDVVGLPIGEETTAAAWLRRRLPPDASITCRTGAGPLVLTARLHAR